jgi:hypothetical protein
VLTIEAFSAWLANRTTQVAASDGKIRSVTWAKAWLQSPSRRSYRGIEFHPDANNNPGTEGYLNLWSGFAVKPAANVDPKRYGTFRDHLLVNVCRGDDRVFNWVFGFFAHVVQRPRERLGAAFVLRGRMGSGKTKVGEVFGRIFPRHYFLVDDARYVTGHFNAHMATCLLLQADEAVWAADKAAAGRLKGLITSPIQQIEAKGIDPIRLPNYVRLIMTSNEDWVVPAGMNERRFCVLDIDPRCEQNHEYFREIDEELEHGGLEYLLADLLAFNLDTVNLRQIPRTEALLEQKIRSLESVEGWWFERLMSGSATRHETRWLQEVPRSLLFDDYIAITDKIGVRRKQEETVFGIKLGRLVPNLGHTRRSRSLVAAPVRHLSRACRHVHKINRQAPHEHLSDVPAHYPGGTNGCSRRLLPRPRSLPLLAGRSASALSLSRPPQASLTLRPSRSLSRLKRPLSRGSSPSGYPAEPLVSYQTNRQVSGWLLPPQVIRAFGAHCQKQTMAQRKFASALGAGSLHPIAHVMGD